MQFRMNTVVDSTGRHTVFVLREDGYFWQFDPHTREWEELPPVPLPKRVPHNPPPDSGWPTPFGPRRQNIAEKLDPDTRDG